MLNYFELFNLPVSFTMDIPTLTKSYYALSRQSHPDMHTLKSAEEKSQTLILSTQINEGYKILKDEMLRFRHVLELCGVTFEEGKESVPQEFLMEVMDINEAIMEYKMDPDDEKNASILSAFEVLETKLKLTMSPIISTFELQELNPNDILELKAYYLKYKYLTRIKNNLKNG